MYILEFPSAAIAKPLSSFSPPRYDAKVSSPNWLYLTITASPIPPAVGCIPSIVAIVPSV